jgi:predicted SnoaL-like aldol condensation-catalyzing enzyme
MAQTRDEKTKAFVLEAFELLFNKRDYAAAEAHWVPSYIQHSAHIPAGRDGLIGLTKSVGPDFKYENHVIVVNGDWVLMHGRFTGGGLPVPWVVADVIRMENGLLAEHWDVVQNEATKEESKSGLPMFGDSFYAGPSA